MNPIRKIALVAVLVLAGLPVSHAAAAFPGGNGKIAFSSIRDGLEEVFSMNADGSAQTNLTQHEPGGDVRPAFSPDGQRIAFVSARDADLEIYVMNADGSGQTRLTSSAGADDLPAWSPDGTKIVFESYRLGAPEVFVMNADGSNQTNLTNNAAIDGAPVMSPDGQKIAFHSYRDGNQPEIYSMSATGSGQTRLTNNTTFDGFPNWSPDGQKLAFESNRDGSREIFSMDADGSNPTNLTNNAATDSNAAWSPDGQKIAFTSHRDGNTEIYSMDADGSNQTNLSNNDGADVKPDWAPVGDTDGDFLPDSWEENGLDVDGDDVADLDLPAMGADPDHKDIFLELDVMPGHELSQGAIDHVIAAFAIAPVTNPDLVGGITLHVDNGPASVMSPAADTWGELSEQDTLTHEAVLGTSDSFGYDWTELDAIKAANFSTDREPAFHYVVSGHSYASPPLNDSSGISRGIGASDLLVTLGAASEPAEGSGTVRQQAGTLMHELGHNLGLRHGGNTDFNYKPNYLSIMNYSFQMGWLRRANGTLALDYSRFQIPLNESALNESSGFGLLAASPAAAFKTLAGCPGDPAPLNAPSILEPIPLLAGPVDWNCNGTADGIVAADINDDGAQTGFATSIDDWDALVYDGGAIGSAGGTVTLPATTEMIEPQLEELVRAEQALDDELRPLPVAKPPAATTPEPPAKKKCKKGRNLKKGKCPKKKRKKN